LLFEEEHEGRILQLSVIPVASEAHARYANLYATDITERKKSEELLRESEVRFRGLFEGIQDPVCVVVGSEGVLIDYNKAFKKLLGYTDEELKDKGFMDFVHPDDRARVLEKYRTTYSENELPLIYEIKGLNKRGEAIPLEITVSTYKKKGRVVGIEVILRDITQRKRMEEELKESEEGFRDLYESIQDPVAIYVGREGRLLECNKAFKRHFKITDKELKGKYFLSFVHPDERAHLLEKYRTDYSEDKYPLVFELKGLSITGEALPPLEISVSPYKKKGRIIGIEVFHRDISERKRMEEEIRESEARARALNEKLRVVGSLTRHDVRNKLTAVVGNTYLLKNRLTADSDAIESLRSIEMAVRESVRIFDFASAYEKLGVEQLVYMDVRKTVEEAVGLFPDLKGVKIVNDCGGLTLLADSLLRQLFYNLIDDSLKYGEKLTQIRIHYEESEDKLKLVYEDNGVGISQDAKPKLFTEGFTTGKGSGYGLYMIRRMMDVYGWAIDETGAPSKGAQFTISIPKAKPDGRQNYKLS
jgi:PAS domain S-box-containing protein